MKLISNPDIKFHIIGMGPKEEVLIKLIKEYGLENKVFYYGPIPAKKAAKYFASADALYIPLKGEGYVGKTLPNKLMMSMAFGKPLIGVLTGDGKNAILDANCGLIADETPESLADAINKMAGLSLEERKKLGHNSQVYYENNYSLKKVSELVDLALKGR
jgi:glycosyltransferase involved in cell wall biosynthesis